MNDVVWRKEIVAASQECIKNNGGWDLRLKELAAITQLNLDNPKQEFQKEEFIQSVITSKKYEYIYVEFLKKIFSAIIKITPKFILKAVYKLMVALDISIPYVFVAKAKQIKQDQSHMK